MHARLTSFALAFTLLLPAAARAATYEIRPADNLWARLATLAPGDEVIVHAGTYTQTSRFEATWAGTAAMPIVVRAATGEARPVLTRDNGQNLMNLHGSYFTLRGFELVGGSHALRLSDVDHGTFEDLRIHGTADVGLSCNIADGAQDPNGCQFVTVRGCEIYETSGTGEGMYLGCNNGACVFSDGLIERNYVHDLGGSQGDGIEIKGGSYGNTVRDNVIVRSNYPGITLYTFTPGAGRNPNVVERNLVWHTQDNGIQITGRAIVRNNVVVDAGQSGIASIVNQGNPSDAVIVHNTVFTAGDTCFRANGWAGQTGFVLANNAFYCEATRAIRITSATTAVIQGNIVRGIVEGASTGVTMGVSASADLGGEAAMARVSPPAGSRLIDQANAANTVSDDFDGRARGAMPDVGAYERVATGPLWNVVEGFKSTAPPVMGTDAGVPVADAGPLADAGSATGSDAGAQRDLGVAPATDGGVTGRDGGATGTDAGSATGIDGGSATVTPAGCGCRVGGMGGTPIAGLLWTGTLGFVLARRRRDASREPVQRESLPRRSPKKHG